MMEFLTFRKMITPMIIQIVFWLGVLGVLGAGFGAMAEQGFFLGLIALVLGLVLWRIWCELVIIFFSINDSLSEIRRNTAR